MDDGGERAADDIQDIDRRPRPILRLKRGALAFYYVSFAVVTAITVYGMVFDSVSDALIGLPMMLILGVAIFNDRHVIHVPPEMIVLVIAAFFLSLIGRGTSGDNEIAMFASNVLTGINLGLIGLILIYVVLRTVPGSKDENHAVIGFIAMCIAVAGYSLLRLFQYVLSLGDWVPEMDLDAVMTEMGAILVGSLLVAVFYGIQHRENIFGGIVNSFMEENAKVFGVDDNARADIEELIKEGESERLEFKSTLRTNLQTGETDKRMEKAVLKTIVAFLNSSGGDLLIGVSDDGGIIGADVTAFENKDKMNLHLSNLISSQIGSAFLPYIWFRMVDFDDRTVIRVSCKPCRRPVFLKDGKLEIFYIRKGPQSEELTGNSLISYVNNRRTQRLSKSRVRRRVRTEKRRRGFQRVSQPPGTGAGAFSLRVLFLDEVEGLLRLGEGPRDEYAHDDRQNGDDDRIDTESDKIFGGAEDLGDQSLDGLVPCQRGDQCERSGNQGRERLENLNFESIAFRRHSPSVDYGYLRFALKGLNQASEGRACGGGDSNP